MLPKLLRLLATLCAIIACASPVRADDVGADIVPFAFDAVTPNPLIQVSVNGNPPMWFLLDTGAPMALALQPWAAERLGLKPDVVSDGKDPAETTTISNVGLIGRSGKEVVRFDLHSAYILDLGILDATYGIHRVAGLVGLQILSPVTARLNFADKTLTIFESAPTLDLLGSVVLPLTVNAQGVATVSVGLAPGKSVDLPIDTGSMFTSIPLSSEADLTPKDIVTRHWSVQVNGAYMCPDVLLPSIGLGSYDLPGVTVEALPETARYALGLNVLTHFIVTLDIPHNQLILTPRAPMAGGYGQGWTGIYFDPSSVRWLVNSLEAGAPGRSAGILPGDEVLAIDGHDLAGMASPLVLHLLDGDAGAPAMLKIRRGKKQIQVSFKRGDEFQAPKMPFDGLVLRKPPTEGGIDVIGTQKGTPAVRAGIKVGDVITQVDGEPTSVMTIDQLSSAFMAQAVHLEITRPGSAKPLAIELKADG